MKNSLCSASAELENQINIEEQEQLLEQLKINRILINFKQKFIQLGLCSLFLVSVLLAVGLVVLVVWYFCDATNPILETIIVIIQLLSGLLSLAVGIWALCITLDSQEATARLRRNEGNVRQRQGGGSIEPKKETDVDL